MISGNEMGRVRVLLELLSKTYIAREDLVLLFNDKKSIHPVLKELSEDSLIKEDCISFLYNGRRKEIKYYSLTDAGLRFLHSANYKNNIYSWIKFAEQLPDKVSISGSNPINERYLNTTGTMLFLEDIIKKSECIYPLGAEQNFVKEFVDNNSPYQAVIIPDDTNPLTYFDGFTVKRIAKESSAQPLELNNGRYIGLISSGKKTCLVYHTEYAGVPWNKWYAESDKKTMLLFTKASDLIKSKIGEEKAILIVRNEKDLAYAHWDRERVRRQNEKIGDGFNEFVVFPQTIDGKKWLLQYMQTDRKELENEVMANALYELDDDGENVYSINSSYPNPKLFPLYRTEDKTLIHIGCVMDLQSVKQLERYLSKQIESISLGHPAENKIAVMCHKWQAPYYKMLLPMIEAIEI